MKRNVQLSGILLVAVLAIAACGKSAPTPTPVAMAEPTPSAMMETATATPDAMKGEAMPAATPDSMATSDAGMMDEGTATPEAMMDEAMPATTPDSMATPDSGMMDEGTATPEAMMDEAMPAATPDSMATSDTSMMHDATPTPEAMMGEAMPAATPDSMSAADGTMSEAPAWFGATLTDVTTGESFTVNDFKGKVVLVENMAVWCSTCLRQQQEVKALRAALGARDDLVNLTLDVDPNEDAPSLQAYVAKNGFGGHYVVAPADVAREIGNVLGNQFLNPPSAPMFVIDRQGQVHPLPFGVKSAQALQDALEPYLAEMM